MDVYSVKRRLRFVVYSCKGMVNWFVRLSHTVFISPVVIPLLLLNEIHGRDVVSISIGVASAFLYDEGSEFFFT